MTPTPEALLRMFAGNNLSPPAIADIARSSWVCAVVVRGAIGRTAGIYIAGTDNLDALTWPGTGNSRDGRARRMLSAFTIGLALAKSMYRLTIFVAIVTLQMIFRPAPLKKRYGIGRPDTVFLRSDCIGDGIHSRKPESSRSGLARKGLIFGPHRRPSSTQRLSRRVSGAVRTSHRDIFPNDKMSGRMCIIKITS